MYNIRLLSGVSIQIQIPRSVKRTKPGALYLQLGSPVQINDEEAEFIKGLMDTQLKNLRIILDHIPEKQQLDVKPKLEPKVKVENLDKLIEEPVKKETKKKPRKKRSYKKKKKIEN